MENGKKGEWTKTELPLNEKVPFTTGMNQNVKIVEHNGTPEMSL